VQGVGVNLDKDSLVSVLPSDLFENGSHHATGTAGIRIKINNDRQPGFSAMFLQQAIEF
jgi:hypothetical protein